MEEDFEDDIPVEGIDTALILENKLKARVTSIVNKVLRDEVNKVMAQAMIEAKDSMLMEISIKVGQMLRGIEKEERVPLWQQAPFDFRLDKGE